MKPHKWAKEIKAWADGAEIEYRNINFEDWASLTNTKPSWQADEYRIKPQPKEPQYLYVYRCNDGGRFDFGNDADQESNRWKYIGKIKLEDE